MSTGSTSRAMGGLAALSACMLIWALMVAVTPAAAGPANVTASVLLAPDTIGPGSHTQATVTLTNETASPATDVAVVVTLPTGVTIGDAQTVQTSCTNGVVSGPASGTTFSLSDALLGASQSCQLVLDITSSTAGDYDIDTDTPTSSLGSGQAGGAELTVDNGLPGFSKSFSPSVVTQGRDTTLTFTIDNTANSSDAISVAFRDQLPAGLAVADIPNVTFAGCEFPLGVPAGPEPGATVIELVSNDGVTAPAPDQPTFAGGSPSPCTMSVDITAAAPAPETNRTGNLGSVVGNNFVESGFALADLTVIPQVFRAAFLNNPVPPGGVAQVRYTIDNVGASFTDGMFSSDLLGLPTGTTIAAPLPTAPCGPSSSLADDAGSLVLSGAALLSGASCSFDVGFQLAANAPVGSYTHSTGQLTITPSDEESEDGRGPSDVQVESQPRGSSATIPGSSDILVVDYRPLLTKTFPDGDAGEGGNTTLRFTITNDDPTDAMTDITFIDDMTAFTGSFPAAVTLPGPDPCGAGSNLALVSLGTDLQGLELTGGTLDPGTSCTFDVVVTMPPGINGERVNQITEFTATHRAATVFGSAPDATLTVLPAPTVTATVVGDPVIAGGAPILQLDLAHSTADSGDPPASAIGLTVDLGGALTGLAATGTPINSACGTSGGTVSGTSVISLSGASLAAGETCQVQIPLSVPGNADPGAYPITTSAITATVDGLPVTGTEASDDLDILGVSLAVEWKDEPALPGSTATITYRLQNHTPSTTYNNISFSHLLSSVVPNATVTDTTQRDDLCGSGSSLIFAGALAFLSSGSLAGTQACEFDITINVPAATVSDNYAHPTSAVSYGGLVAPPANDVLTVDNVAVDLKKEFIDDPVKAGEQVTLRYTLTNLSPSQSLEDLTFTDDLNAALPGLAATGLPATDVCGTGSTVSGTSTVTLAGGTLGIGGSCALDITLFVPANANTGTAAATLTSDVSGTAQPANVGIVGSGASDVLQIAGDVIFSHAFDGPTVAGGSPTVTYTVTNTSPSLTLQDVRFSHDLDSVLTGLAATGAPPATPCGAGSSAGGTSVLTLTGTELLPGATCSFSATLGVPAGAAPGSLPSQTSSLQTAGIDIADPSMATLEIEPPPTFAKAFSPDTIGVGEQSRLTYTITNTASAVAASSLAFTDVLPAGLAVADPADDATTCGGTVGAPAGGASISLAGGSVGAGSTCTVAVDVTGASAGTFISATGDLTSSSGNSGPATDTITVSAPAGGGGGALPPGGGADFALSITPQDAAIRTGDTATFALTVTNLGPIRSGATLSYALSGGTIDSADGGCSTSGCPIAALDPTESVTVTLTTSHPADATGALNAVVTSTLGDPNGANNSATANFTVSEDPGVNPAGVDGIIENAISVSQERFTPVNGGFAGVPRQPAAFVVLARADVFADALAGSVLTGDAPLLFTFGDALAPNTGEEIQRVLAAGGTVYLLGGEAALSADVEAALSDAGFTPQRLAGPSRIETALAVADEAQALYGQGEVGVARAYGTEDNPTAAWADSVTGGGWAAATGAPIVLTPTSAPLHPAVETWMAANANPADTVILGGPAAISEAVRAALGTDRRVAGAERGGTAVQIARDLRGVAPEGARSYLLVNGFTDEGWAYGLVAAGLSADLSAPVLLTNSTSAPAATVDEVTSCEANPVTLRRMSPAAALADTLLAELDALDSAACQESGDPEGDGRGDQDTP